MTTAMASFKSSSNEISPTIPSGVPRMKGYIMMGMAVLTAVYVTLVYALKDSVSALTDCQSNNASTASPHTYSLHRDPT